MCSLSCARWTASELAVLLLAAGSLQISSVLSLALTLDVAAVWDLLTSKDACISENQLLHVVVAWCKANQPMSLSQMMMHIDFGLLNHNQVYLNDAVNSFVSTSAKTCMSRLTG